MTLRILVIVALGMLGSCAREAPPVRAPEMGDEAGATPGRVEISPVVRRNLGITFAGVERRRVERTIRIPGAFELRPLARREYRLTLPGTVRLAVDQYERIGAGDLLFRFRSPRWPELQHEIVEGEQSIGAAEASIGVARARIEETTARLAVLRARLASLELLERNLDAHLRRAAQVAAHQILATPSLDGVVSTIVEACRGKEGHDLLTAMATAIDGLQAALVEGCGPFFEGVVMRRTRRMTEEELDLLVRAAVRRQVEAEVFVPLSSVLDESLRRDLEEEETALQTSCAAARLKTQAALGCIASPSRWEAAVYRLATVGSYTLPCDRLDVLLAAAREVPIIFAAEHGGDEVLGGDDFLPIFVYVVVQAGIPDLRYLQTVLSALCDPDKRLSETGYYVATFEAAVEHVRALPLARVLGEENPFAP